MPGAYGAREETDEPLGTKERYQVAKDIIKSSEKLSMVLRYCKEKDCFNL